MNKEIKNKLKIYVPAGIAGIVLGIAMLKGLDAMSDKLNEQYRYREVATIQNARIEEARWQDSSEHQKNSRDLIRINGDYDFSSKLTNKVVISQENLRIYFVERPSTNYPANRPQMPFAEIEQTYL